MVCAQLFELYQMMCSFSCDHVAPQNKTFGIKSRDKKVEHCFGVWVGLQELVLTLNSQVSSVSSQGLPGILPHGQCWRPLGLVAIERGPCDHFSLWCHQR